MVSKVNALFDNDVFGRRMIYTTNTDSKVAKPWFLGKDDWKSRAPNWDEQNDTISTERSTDEKGNLRYKVKILKTSDNDVKKIKTRFRVQSVPGNETVTETNQSILRDREYMGTERDWKNVEVTFYAKINKQKDTEKGKPNTTNGGPHFELEARSGLHGDGRPPCEGTALHTNIYPNGRVKLEKELSHTKGYSGNNPQKTNAIDSLRNWFGMKGIFYNTNEGNVKIEIWLDKEANNVWGDEPVFANTDDGGWHIEKDPEKNPKGENECPGGQTDEKIVWGGPVVIFRSDQLTEFEIKWASVREIIPPI
jgi:hypothetical protein